VIASVTGLSAVAAYALLVSVLPSNKVGAVVASMFGPLVGCASVGLYRVLAWRRETTPDYWPRSRTSPAGHSWSRCC
jgi:hypothetical protein